jgi:hypothetical protein
MLEWLERRFKSAYLRCLEDRVRRLEDEQRQLVNSLLVHSGLPQIEAPRAQATKYTPINRPSWPVFAARKQAEALPQEVNTKEN